MSEKNTLRTRLVNKHDIEANWLKAINFTPLQGELIVYDADENYNYERIKMGDGVTNVNELPFISSQADWNQNDPSAPDYVKNRTHWEEDVVILPETEITLSSDGAPITTAPNAMPEVGSVYAVAYNGTAYDCPAVAIPDGLDITGFLIGNSDAMGIPGGNTSAPFLVMLFDAPVDETGDGNLVHGTFVPMGEFAEGTTATLSIVQVGAAIHKLAPKFLPDTVVMAERPEIGVKEIVILPETEYPGGGTDTQIPITTPLSAMPTPGATAIVTWNGTEYACQIARQTESGNDGYLMGNFEAMGAPYGGSNPDAPFVVALVPAGMGGLYGVIMPVEEVASITLSIVQTEGGATPQQLVMDKDGNIKWEDRTHWVEPALVDILPETTYADEAALEAAITLPLSASLVAGNVYQVTLNGAVYECNCIAVTEDGMTIPVLGNTNIMNITGGNPDAPFIFLEAPAGIAASQGMYWQFVLTDDTIAFPITLSVKYDGEVVHKIDNKFLNIATPNWNALPGTAGYIENRTHYCDHVVMTYDSTKLSGADTLITSVGDNVLRFYKIGDYVLDAASLKAAFYTITDLSTGEQETLSITSAQDNDGWSGCMSQYFFVYSVSDLAAAATQDVHAPSVGTYLLALSEKACTITIDAGEILKKLDEKYLPDNTINTVNSVNGQTGDVTLTAADVGAVADTLNIENGAGGFSLQGASSLASATGNNSIALGTSIAIGNHSFSRGSEYLISVIPIAGDAGSVTYTSKYDAISWGANVFYYNGKYARILDMEHTDEGTFTYTLSNTLSDSAITYSSHVCAGLLTIASGDCSRADGEGSESRGRFSHADGRGARVYAESGSAIGDYNLDQDPVGYYVAESTDKQKYNLTRSYSVCLDEPKIDMLTGNIIFGETVTKLGSELKIGDYMGGTWGFYYNEQHVTAYQQLISIISEDETSKTFSVRRVFAVNLACEKGTYALMIGNGTLANRSNAHAVDWDGNAYYAGDVYVQGDGMTFEFDGKKKLATESYVDSKIPTPEDALALMIEMGFVDPVANETGAMYTDDNGKIFTY